MPDPAATAAFDALVRARYAGLCTFAYRLVRSRAVAEDIVQDVFAGLWQRADRFDYADPLPFLYQAVRNRAVSHLRGERVRARAGRRTLSPSPRPSARSRRPTRERMSRRSGRPSPRRSTRSPSAAV